MVCVEYFLIYREQRRGEMNEAFCLQGIGRGETAVGGGYRALLHGRRDGKIE